jgi:hypothetical protein
MFGRLVVFVMVVMVFSLPSLQGDALAKGPAPMEKQKGGGDSADDQKGWDSSGDDQKPSKGNAGSADRQDSDVTADEIDIFVKGNLLFTLYHEAGHALISLFDLPVLAREEDAVDNLATLLMLPDENSTDEQEALLLSAMDGWFISDEAAAEEDEPLAFWDEHGLDAQRGYQIACLLIGSDPDYFSDLAENLEIPEERVDSCIEEQQKVADSWHAVLSKHMLADNERPKGKVTVTYGAAHGDLAIWPGILRRWGLAEQVAADLSKNFRLPRDLKLEYAECDEANAWWDPETDTLTVCYEILDEYTYFAKL